jgi:hypothetical protein
MRVFCILVFSGVLLGSQSPLAWASSNASLFDKPLLEKHVPLPRDPDNPQSKPLLSCFYYPHFMVKQVDLGEEGAEQLSILPQLGKDHGQPPCLRANAKDEVVIDSKTWSGYFEGAKGNFVFFVADDGVEGGLSFAVFSGSYGTKIFEDAAISDGRETAFTALVALDDPKTATESATKLSYRRVYVAQCSLRANEKNCWSRIKEITGLTETSPPNCSASYETLEKKYPNDAKAFESGASVITYDVEAVLDSRNSAVRVTPISKAIGCYPED